MVYLKTILPLVVGVCYSHMGFGFVAPKKHQKLRGPTVEVKQRMVYGRYTPLPAGVHKKSQKVWRDEVTGVARILHGGRLGPAGVLQSKTDYLAYAKSYINAHPELFGANPELKLNHDAYLQSGDLVFLQFDVFRNEVRIEDAAINFHFKKQTLIQVHNHSYFEVQVEGGFHKDPSLLAQAAKAAMLAEDVELLEKSYRLEQTKKGYKLIPVHNFTVKDHGHSFNVQMRTNLEVFEVRDNHYHIEARAEAKGYERWYTDDLVDLPLAHMHVEHGALEAVTAHDGSFAWGSEVVAPQISELKGIYVKVNPRTGPEVSGSGLKVGEAWDLSLDTLDQPSEPWLDKLVAQNMIYHHTTRIINDAQKYVDTNWFKNTLVGNANLAFNCNAHWDGHTINFYSGNGECANTGLISDIIYHEWGHGLDAKTGGISDGAFSEGYGDIMAVLQTGSPVLGIGFFLKNHGSIRNLEPDRVYPRDRGEVHAEGLIIGSTFWDLYKVMHIKYADEVALDKLKNFAYKMIFSARTYRDVYNVLLTLDDDDGDLLNGTPNQCMLNEVFTKHGLSEAVSSCKLVSVERVEIADDSFGDGDGVIEPGEGVMLAVSAKNASGEALKSLKGELSIVSDKVKVEEKSLYWHEIPAAGEVKSANMAYFKVAEDAVCGSVVPVSLYLSHDVRDVFSEKNLVIGQNKGQSEVHMASGLPKPIKDQNTTHVPLTVASEQWAVDTLIASAHLKVDIRHTYRGDLRIFLVSPSGAKFPVYKGAGEKDNVHLDEDVSHIVRGTPGAGEWQLEVVDAGRDDVGFVDKFELGLTPALFVCD